MKQLRIPSIILSTKDHMLLLIGEVKYKLVFRRQQKIFWMQNSKTFYRMKIKHDKIFCHVVVVNECQTVQHIQNIFLVNTTRTSAQNSYKNWMDCLISASSPF